MPKPHSTKSNLFAVMAAGLLSACAATQSTQPIGAESGASVASASSTGAATSAALAPGPASAKPAGLPPLSILEPGELMAYSRDRLLAELGDPVFRRLDKGAEILRFKGDGCVLDLFLYPDTSGPAGPDGKVYGGAPRIAHMEARDAQGNAMDRRRCLNLTPRPRTG